MTSPLAGLRLRDLLLRNVELYGRDRAVVCGESVTTWSELAARVCRLANRLAAEGLGRGSRLAVLQRNGPEIVEIYEAAAMLGAVVVPVSERLTHNEVAYVVGDSQVQLAFVEAGHPALGAFDALRVVETRSLGYAAFVDEGDASEPPSHEEPDDPVLQLYTSGTTGRPKGAVVSQAAMVQHGLTIQLSQRLRHEDVFLTTTPLTHAASGTRVFSLTIDGMTHVILERFSPEAFVDAVERHRATTTLVVPTMLQDILDSPAFNRDRLSSLRFIVYGAAPAPAPLVERALAELPCGLLHGYGLTEGAPGLASMDADEHRVFAADPALRYRLGSIGRPIPGVRFKVVGDDGAQVAPGEVGELLVRSTKSMLGYWQKPDATAETIRDGWLATGDVGHQDADGYLFLVDRKKDMLISGGLNVYPSEIERVLVEDADVREVAVVGLDDPRWGEVPIAFVVAPALAGGVERLGAVCKEQLAGYKQPRRIVIVDALPRNETGKVLKGVLREWARA